MTSIQFIQGCSYVEAMEAVASSLFGSYNCIHIYNCQTFNCILVPSQQLQVWLCGCTIITNNICSMAIRTADITGFFTKRPNTSTTGKIIAKID